MPNSHKDILNLYKNLIRESKKFSNFNYRMYALRRVRDAFRENQNLTDQAKVEEVFKYGLKNLDIIKRQVVVNQLFKSNNLVIENEKRTSKVKSQ
jgi:LYR motif-containing protein 4